MRPPASRIFRLIRAGWFWCCGFAAALSAGVRASGFSGKLSNSTRRYHIASITAAKSADTGQRRTDNAIALFRAGKQR